MLSVRGCSSPRLLLLLTTSVTTIRVYLKPSAFRWVVPPSRLGLPWSVRVDKDGGAEAGTKRSAQPFTMSPYPRDWRLLKCVFLSRGLAFLRRRFWFKTRCLSCFWFCLRHRTDGFHKCTRGRLCEWVGMRARGPLPALIFPFEFQRVYMCVLKP